MMMIASSMMMPNKMDWMMMKIFMGFTKMSLLPVRLTMPIWIH